MSTFAAAADRPIVVGAGLAGLMAALHLAPAPVLVISRAPLGEQAASAWAQGGLAAAIGPDDSTELHLADTLAAGDGLCDADVARQIVEAGPALVEELLRLGARFDRAANGDFRLGLEAGHGRRRIVHAKGDGSGREILRAVIEAVRRTPSIEVREGVSATRLVLRHGEVAGLVIQSDRGQEVLPGSRVIVATGGLGGLYMHTTNPAGAVGGGLMLAARAGAALADLEFVQFHPTALDADPAGDRQDHSAGDRQDHSAGDRQDHSAGDRQDHSAGDRPGHAPMPLISEAVRGEGAYLIDETGVRFMEGQGRAELEPRDVVSRAVWARMAEGHRVFLDARACLGTGFAANFPAIHASCLAAGIDPARMPIPVRPAAHYHMGGVAVDGACRSTVPGLWAVGEAACTGLHGANRLASNSLLEAAVTGRIAAESVGGTFARLAAPIAAVAPAVWHDPAPVRAILSRDAGVLRDAEGLRRAIGELLPMTGDAAGLALMMTVSMLQRQESRGGHARTDFPAQAAPQRTRCTLAEAYVRARQVVHLGAASDLPAPARAVPPAR